MNYWSCVDNETGRECFIEARLWYEARALGIQQLADQLGHPVSQDGVHVTAMESGWRPEPETSTGALMGNVNPKGDARP
jgi:hypothetical protein